MRVQMRIMSIMKYGAWPPSTWQLDYRVNNCSTSPLSTLIKNCRKYLNTCPTEHWLSQQKQIQIPRDVVWHKCSVTAEHSRRQATLVRWSSERWMISIETASTSCLSCCNMSCGADRSIYAWRRACHCRRVCRHACQTPMTQICAHWHNQLCTHMHITCTQNTLSRVISRMLKY